MYLVLGFTAFRIYGLERRISLEFKMGIGFILGYVGFTVSNDLGFRIKGFG